MRVWLLINGPHNLSEDTAYLVGRLAARASRIVVSRIDDAADAVPEPPEPVDVVFNRLRHKTTGIFESVARVAARHALPVTNPSAAAVRANDKRTLPEDFPDLVPETRVVGDLDAFARAFRALGGNVVVKEPFGRHGTQVRRVQSENEFATAAALLAEARAGEIVVQPFLEGFTRGDRRIITVRDATGRPVPVAAFTRLPAPGNWICNLSSGGRCVIEAPTGEEAELAVAVAERSGLDIAQLDFGWHDGRLYLIETNQSGGGFIDYDIGHRANCADAVARWIEALATHGRPAGFRSG